MYILLKQGNKLNIFNCPSVFISKKSGKKVGSQINCTKIGHWLKILSNDSSIFNKVLSTIIFFVTNRVLMTLVL